jgi:tRNA (guanine-N7-)-methyltransferase
MTRGPYLLPEPVGQELVGVDAPPDWDVVFGASGPLELEIGCGMGGFALAHAREHPDTRYVAFEWRKKYARYVQARADKLGLTNVRVIEADARVEIPRLFLPGTLSVIHLQFPDPWWKRSHHKRAILQAPFARLLYELTKPGGHFDLRTDVEDRALQMMTTLEQAGFVNPLGRGVFHPYDPGDLPSSRERRYLASGQPVYRARLHKP